MSVEYHTKEVKGIRRCVPQRYVIGFLGFCALANGYIQRFSLSLTITEMASAIYHPPSNTSTECPGGSSWKNFIVHDREFDWSEKTQGIILSSVFWGYVLSQLPGGILAERFGGKHTLGFGMLCSTLSTLFTPFIVRKFDSIGMIAVRFIIGLGQGALYPSLNVLLSHWAPLTERGRLGSLVFAGAQVGNIVSTALSGILINFFGWPSVFYIYGILGIVWYCFWLIFVSNDPSSNSFITEKEKQFLSESVKDVARDRRNLPGTPWCKIFTSPAVWALIVAQIGHDWGLFTIISDMPKYMKSILHFSVAQNGLLSAIPYIVMWISALICGIITDCLIEKRNWNITLVRKIFITIASIGPGLGMVAAGYSYCNKIGVSTSFTVGMGLMGAFVPSLKVNSLDLSPNYAGTLLALVGGIGAISGIFAPFLVGVLTTNGTLSEWRNVFWVSFLILATTNVVYLVFGSAEVEPWNSGKEIPTDTEQKTKNNTIKEYNIEMTAQKNQRV